MKSAYASHTAAAAIDTAIATVDAHAAARNTAPVDTISDAYYSAYAAYTAFAADTYYVAQDVKLIAMIDQYFAEGTPNA